MHTPKRYRSGQWPWRPRTRRVGGDEAFAKAITRLEFGRFYTDDAREKEVARSLARARQRRQNAPEHPQAREEKPNVNGKAKKPIGWRPPSVRERRTEIADAMARVAAAARCRKEAGEG